MAAVEPSSEQVDKVYEIIEVARTTGKIKKGTNEATKAIEKGKAKFVVIAKDVQPAEIVMHIPALAQEKGVPCVRVPSKEELGTAAGVDRPASAVVVLEEGESKNLIKQFASHVSE